MTLEFRKREIERNEGSDSSRLQTLGLRFREGGRKEKGRGLEREGGGDTKMEEWKQ